MKLVMRCKKTSHTLGLAQRLRILRTGKVFVYATGIKEHGTVIVSAVDADVNLEQGVAVARARASDIPLWRLGWAALKAICRMHGYLMLALEGSVVLAVLAWILAHR